MNLPPLIALNQGNQGVQKKRSLWSEEEQKLLREPRLKLRYGRSAIPGRYGHVEPQRQNGHVSGRDGAAGREHLAEC